MKWQLMFDKVSKSGDIKEKVVKKFAGLETFLGKTKNKVGSGFMKLSRGERWGYKVKAMFRVPGKEIVAEGKGKTLLSAIDEAYSRSTRETRKYLDRLKSKR